MIGVGEDWAEFSTAFLIGHVVSLRKYLRAGHIDDDGPYTDVIAEIKTELQTRMERLPND